MLHADPTLRPSMSDLLADEFFTSGYAPVRLPTSCLTVPPRFSIAPSSLDPALLRKPLSALNKGTDEQSSDIKTLYSLDTGFCAFSQNVVVPLEILCITKVDCKCFLKFSLSFVCLCFTGTDSPIEKMGKMEQPQREDLQQRSVWCLL